MNSNDQTPTQSLTILFKNNTQQPTQAITLPIQFSSFSPLLQNSYPTNSQKISSKQEFVIPSTANIQPQSLLLIKHFLQLHQYNSQNVVLTKIHLNNYKDNVLPPTKKFIEDKLQKMNDGDIKKLLKCGQYLGVSVVNQVIYLYLANQYAVSYSKDQKQRQMQENGVQKYSPKDVRKMREKYYLFFQGFAKEQLDQYQQKNKSSI